MAKVYVVNGVRCVPENNNALSLSQRAMESNASQLRAVERFELKKLTLNLKAAEILKSL